jgi:hypothetical protein
MVDRATVCTRKLNWVNDTRYLIIATILLIVALSAFNNPTVHSCNVHRSVDTHHGGVHVQVPNHLIISSERAREHTNIQVRRSHSHHRSVPASDGRARRDEPGQGKRTLHRTKPWHFSGALGAETEGKQHFRLVIIPSHPYASSLVVHLWLYIRPRPIQHFQDTVGPVVLFSLRLPLPSLA